MTRVDRREFSGLIPHAGSMILLDEVEQYDDQRLVAVARSHLLPENPLRDSQGRIPIACGIEYAAQAMAVHAGLLRRAAEGAPHRKPCAGLLAGLRGVDFFAERLDDASSPLRIEVATLSADDRVSLHEFEIRADGRLLLSGRATIVFDAVNLRNFPSRAAGEVSASAE